MFVLHICIALALFATTPDTKQQLFDSLAGNEFCGCNSPLTLSACLISHPQCKTGILMRDVLMRAIDINQSLPTLENFFSQELLGPLCAPPITLHIDHAPRQGKAGARMQIIEFADFRCAHCRQASHMVKQTIARYRGQIELTYVPVALMNNSKSSIATEAALAAHAQNQFWPMSAELFAIDDDDFSMPVLRGIAKKIGLDMQRFDHDMQKHVFANTLADFNKAASDAGITGTPAFFINGRPYSFHPHIYELADRIELELRRDEKTCQ